MPLAAPNKLVSLFAMAMNCEGLVGTMTTVREKSNARRMVDGDGDDVQRFDCDSTTAAGSTTGAA
jgi:hypothetical protein